MGGSHQGKAAASAPAPACSVPDITFPFCDSCPPPSVATPWLQSWAKSHFSILLCHSPVRGALSGQRLQEPCARRCSSSIATSMGLHTRHEEQLHRCLGRLRIRASKYNTYPHSPMFAEIVRSSIIFTDLRGDWSFLPRMSMLSGSVSHSCLL